MYTLWLRAAAIEAFLVTGFIEKNVVDCPVVGKIARIIRCPSSPLYTEAPVAWPGSVKYSCSQQYFFFKRR